MPYEPTYTPNPNKRFDISTDKYSCGRLEAVREVYVDLKKRYPSVGIALFGSLSKGKVLTHESHTMSDVDAWIYIDVQEIDPRLTEAALRQDAQVALAKRLAEKEQHSQWHMVNGIHVVAFDAKKIVDDLTHTNPKESEESADIWYNALDDASKLFHLDVGGGLAKFRKALLREMTTLPPDMREKIWKEISNQLIVFERDKTVVPAGLMRQYPATFEEALRYYRAR